MGRIIRPSSIPGRYPDIFKGMSGRFRHSVPGVQGQYVQSLHPFTSVGDGRLTDVYGWPIGDLGTPRFEYRSGDGDFFRLNGAPTAFDDTTGALEENVSTPWTGSDGQARVGTHVAAGVRRVYTTAPVDPAAGQATVICALLRPTIDGTTSTLLATRDFATGINGGWTLFKSSGNNVRFSCGDGGVTAISISPNIYPGWQIIGVLHLPGNRQYLYQQGLLVDDDSCAGQGVIASTDGVAVNALIGGGVIGHGCIARLAFWYPTVAVATAVCTNAWFARVARYILGVRDAQTDGASTFDRDAAASIPVGTRVHLIGHDGPRTCADGLLVEPERVNELRNSINPQVNTGYSRTAGAHNIVGDSANLGVFREVGPNVHQFIPGGGDAVIYSDTTVGDLDTRSTRFLIRGGAGGEDVNLVLRDGSTGGLTVIQNIACTIGYAEVVVHGFVPGDTDESWGLDCDAGDTIYFVAQDMQKGARMSTVIPNISTVASAIRPTDDFITTHDPDNLEGSIELEFEPIGWSADQLGTIPIFYLTGGGTAMLWVEGGTYRAQIDGSTNLDSGVQPVSGTRHRIRLRWATGAQQSIEVWFGEDLLANVESVYDGSLYAAGTVQVYCGGTAWVNLTCYRSGGGGR